MTKFRPDDILESLYKLRIRESEQLKTVLELYNMEIHQKKAEPDFRRLKTMVKRSIEQNLRSRSFEARNGIDESGAFVKNEREQRRVQKGPGDCWQWKASGQCSKGDNCSFRHDKDKRAKPKSQPAPSPEPSTQQYGKKSARAKVLEAEVRLGECLVCRARNILEVLVRIHLVKSGIPQSVYLFYKTKEGCKFGEKCSYAYRRDDEQPNKKTQKRMVTKVL